MAGGGATKEVMEREGDKPLVPGSPVSVAMVTGDFDLSGIGTVTHVEGDRVYAFGHPMMGLGACELPMMTGYIHTVYPRSSVSMKLGSPLKVVGVLDTDVSTAVSGRLGAKPDMLPVSVSVRSGRFAETHAYHVQVVREPHMLPTLLLSTLANAIDTEGDLPSQLTARIAVEIGIKGHEPMVLHETLSGARYSGPMGASSLFGPIVSTVGVLVRNPLEPVRIESINCRVEIEPGEQVASVESVRLASDRIEPGQTLRIFATLKPNLGERKTIELSLPIPKDFPEGNHEVSILDVGHSLSRRFPERPFAHESSRPPGADTPSAGPLRTDPHRALSARRPNRPRSRGGRSGASRPAWKHPCCVLLGSIDASGIDQRGPDGPGRNELGGRRQ